MIMNKNAQALGHLGKGIPKNYTEEERQRRADRMRMLNEQQAHVLRECFDCHQSFHTTAHNQKRCSPCAKKYKKDYLLQYQRTHQKALKCAKQKYQAKPEYPKIRQNAYLLKRYGMSLVAYHSMLEAQRNTCAICCTPLSPQRGTHVDHNHQTQQIRGILCNACNRGLGYLKDSPQLLQRAIDYLQKPGNMVTEHMLCKSTG